MTEAREYTTKAGAERMLAAVDKALGYPRGYTQADIDSGLITQHGRGCAPLSSIRTESHTRVVRKGSRYAVPWDDTIARLTAEPGVPDGPNATIDDTWTPVTALEVE